MKNELCHLMLGKRQFIGDLRDLVNFDKVKGRQHWKQA